jgi:hypothetical protein
MDVLILGLFIGFIFGIAFCKWFIRTTAKEVYHLIKTKEAEENNDDRDFWKPKGWRPDAED